MKPHAWMLWLVVVLLGAVGAMVVSRGWAEETHTVEPKDTGKVEKNFDIDKDDEEIVNPESVVGEGKITITTKTFKPPTGWKFDNFKEDKTPENRKQFNPGDYVDIEIDPQCLPPVVDAPTVQVKGPLPARENVDEIKVVVTELTVPPTAGNWPLKCEGNLKPPGGGGGKKEWHWSAKVSREKAYYFLWGWMDESVQRIATGVTAIQPVVDKLKAMGYEVYDDGPAFNQAEIDKAFTDDEIKAHPLRVIIDRNTTTANLTTYLQRQTARGLLWAGHGYMEPYPGCPDDDLLKFESRVWTAKAGDPTKSGDRIFVRDLQPLITGKQEHPMNFLVLAQCDTGGFDAEGLADPWHWVKQATKDRVIAKYGTLPPSSHPDFKFKSFDVLAGSASFFKIYVGEGSWIDDGRLDINALSDSVKD